MLRDKEQYERALRFVAELEKKVKAGTATPQERERYRNGCEAIVCWEWEELGRSQRGV